MTTVRELITDAHGLIGVYGVGRTLSAEDAQLGLRKLNQLVESWNIEGRMVYSITRTVTALTIGTGAYTYGAGGTLNVTHPEFIESANILVGTIETPLEMMSASDWAGLSDKTETGPYPTRVYMDGVRPLEGVTFIPSPTSACSFVTYSWAKQAAFTSLDTALTMPNGYEEALETNLAIRLAPFYKVQPDPVLLQLAVNAKNALQSMNMRASTLECNLPGMRDDSMFAQTNGYVD